MKQLTQEQAIAFHDSKAWEPMNHEERAKFQMQQELLCMPFSVFHEAIEKALCRPVFTHELGINISGLRDELFLNKEHPTFDEVMKLIPEDKRIVIAK